jgi:hypothetical protein
MLRSRTWALARRLFPVSAAVVTLAGCELIASNDRGLIPKTTTSTSTSTSTGSGGSGGSGGATATTSTATATATSGTGALECLHAATCPGVDDDCHHRTCIAGQCGLALAPENTPTSKQLPGDCKREVCDAAGYAKLIDDDDDVLLDENQCTLDICVTGTPTHPPSPAGAACTDGGKVCDGANTCVGCLGKAQCGVGEACLDTQCISITCLDLSLDGSETDIDCGGPACNPCGTGKSCLLGSDCGSHVCVTTCQAPSCSDGAKNGPETDVDCGGGCPTLCPLGQGCSTDGDCLGGGCDKGACLPTCKDQVMDGGETDVDCGGSCGGCAVGKGCGSGADCASGNCAGDVCAAPDPTCSNGMLDGNESDTDCGGSSCLDCAVGAKCSVSGNCLTGRCTSGLCAEVLLISEARTRGAGGSLDELVELYNPGQVAVVVDSTWTLSVRSAVGACATNSASVKFTGAGQTVPPHGHLLIVGTGYAQLPTGDVVLMNGGVADAGSLALYHGATLSDALCYAYDASTQNNLTGCAVPYVCAGAPASNAPHDNTQSVTSTVDVSLQRKPGGALGNQVDTGNNSADFAPSKPARPQNLASVAAP